MLKLAFATLATLAASTPAAYASDTIRDMKGHPPIVARADPAPRAAPAVCHPDPMKGRACRHHVAKAEERRAQSYAVAEAEAARIASARP